MFEKTLPDLIRGIRANKKNEQEYIVKSIDEIRKELKTDDMAIKTVAISKLNYVSPSHPSIRRGLSPFFNLVASWFKPLLKLLIFE